MTNLKSNLNKAIKTLIVSKAKFIKSLDEGSQAHITSREKVYLKSILKVETIIETLKALQEDMPFVSFQKEIDYTIEFFDAENISHNLKA